MMTSKVLLRSIPSWASPATVLRTRTPAVLPSRILHTRITSLHPATQSRALATSRRPAPPSLLHPQPKPPRQNVLLLRRRYHYKPSQYDPDGSRLRDAKPLIPEKVTFSRLARSPRTHTIVILAIAGAFIFYFSNLETVPVSGRTRFNIYSAESVKKQSEMQEKLLLYEFERNGVRILPDWDPRTQRVKRVMAKLIPFSGMTDEDWEIYVVDDPRTKNAFVLPGGKVFVFSGILPLARNDSALAAVLGHEIAHNVAGHVGEKMSRNIGPNILLYSLMIVAGGIGVAPFLMHYLGSIFLGLTFENPMSRKQESEADYIGLMMMAEACYDPREALGFWQRMEQASTMDVPEWASTHPSNENRIKKLQEWLPKAMDKRAMSDCQTTSAFADLFKKALAEGFLIIESDY